MSFNRLSIATALLAVVAAGVVPLASASAGPSRSATTYRVTMKISTTRAVANEDTVTLTGTVSPAAPGTKVKVQVRYEGQTAWRKAGSAKVRKNSTYAFSFTPTTRQDRTYRVVKPGDDHATGGHEQGTEAPGHRMGVAEQPDPEPHAGRRRHQHDADQRRELRAHACTRVSTPPRASSSTRWAATPTRSRPPTGSRTGRRPADGAPIAVTTDGVPSFSQTFDLGQSVLQTTNVTDVYRIRIDFSQIADTPVTEPSAGAARVLMD